MKMYKQNGDFQYEFGNKSISAIKTNIHRRLLFRLIIACSIVSVALASGVYYFEYNRFSQSIINRAKTMILRFNDEVRPFLEQSKLAEWSVIKAKLKILSIAGKVDYGLGTLIFIGIYKSNGEPILIERDKGCNYQNQIDALIITYKNRSLGFLDHDYKFHHINNLPHIVLTFPLTNKTNDSVAFIKSVYALSPEAKSEVQQRITRIALEAIGVVLLTTLILYPLIYTLITQLSKYAGNLLKSNIELLQVLGSAIAKRDSETDIHNYRVTIYSTTLAEEFGIGQDMIRGLIKGAFLHDIGKIGISDNILLKPGKLTDMEYELMRGHVGHGIDIVNSSDWLKDSKEVVAYHHERFDGKGYPHGLKGESIPINARIFTIVDVFDALTSKRPYKSKISFREAMGIMEEGRGIYFDPSLLDTFKCISKPLFDNYSNCSELVLRERLEMILHYYFSR